jgi:hypothetical protein
MIINDNRLSHEDPPPEANIIAKTYSIFDIEDVENANEGITRYGLRR